MSDKMTVVNLRTVADRVGLAPCSVSSVLNNSAAAMRIPQRTKDRVFRAAAELNYRPNLSARSLRTKRTHMVAVISNDFGRGPVAHVVSGMERLLRRKGYLLALGALDRPSEWPNLSTQLHQRGIEGVIAVGVSLPYEMTLPAVSVHLGDVNLREPLTNAVCQWLSELGESAAEVVLGKIETPIGTKIETKSSSRTTSSRRTFSRRIRIVAKPPRGYFNIHGDLGIPVESRVQRA